MIYIYIYIYIHTHTYKVYSDRAWDRNTVSKSSVYIQPLGARAGMGHKTVYEPRRQCHLPVVWRQ